MRITQQTASFSFPVFSRKILALGLVSAGLLIQGCNHLPNTGKVIQTEKAVTTAELVSSSPRLQSSAKTVIHQQDASPKITAARLDKSEIVKEHHPIIWDAMRNRFHLAEKNMGKYDKYIEFYQKRQKHFEASAQRSELYLYYIKSQVEARNMPMEIALLPLVESGFKANARSHKAAVGLWQFIPSTGKMYGLQQNWWFDGRRDVIKSTKAALDFLEHLYQKNNQDWLLALASYNAGYGAVLRAQKKYRKKHPNTPEATHLSFWQLQPYLPRETSHYAPKLLAAAHLIQYSKSYQLSLHPVANEPSFEVVKLNKQISLPAVASALKMDSRLLQQLNPGYLRQATPPKDDHFLLLPDEQLSTFQKQYQKDASRFTVAWQRHKIRPGDVLGKIAQKYGTSVRSIKRLNRLSSNRIRIGQTLLIPIADTSGQSIQLAEAADTPKAQKTSGRSHDSFSTYRVKNGDSLWKIARANNVSIQDLKRWNKLSGNATLRPRQILKIAAGINKVALSSNQVNYGQIKKTYQVKSGDNLSLIAMRNGVSVSQIRKWNQLAAKSLIRPGKKLIIWQGPETSKHREYRVKNGDNLWVIAKQHKVSTQKLAKYNSLSLKSLLKPGQVIKIPYQI